jgi:hypothetical protein
MGLNIRTWSFTVKNRWPKEGAMIESMPKKMIDVEETKDLLYWCDELNLKMEELVDIVKQVGPLVHDVRLHMAKKLLLSWPMAY